MSLLLPDSWLGEGGLSPDERHALLDLTDWFYDQFAQVMQGEPARDGLLRIAFVPVTCGFGCGWVGSKGIEIRDDESNRKSLKYCLSEGVPPLLILHEMTHNFDLYSQYLHAWAEFMENYILIYSGTGTGTGVGSLSPEAFQEQQIARFYLPYLYDPTANWEDCVRDGGCVDRGIYDKLTWAGVTLRFAQLHGPQAVLRMTAFLKTYAALHPSPPASAEEREDVHVLAMASGAQLDLGCYVDAWRWYASPTARAAMTGQFGPTNPNCIDGDGDGYSIIAGDADDTDPNEIPSPDAAEYVEDTIPTSMTPGEQRTVSVTMKNVGTSTWTEADSIRLGSPDPDPFYPPSRVMIPPGVTIPPTVPHTFVFPMTAPSEQKTILINWRMVREGIRWFGPTIARHIVVGYPPPGPGSGTWEPGPGYCLADGFSYSDGNLNGKGGWHGDDGPVQVRDNTVQISGGAGWKNVKRTLDTPCGPDADGIIRVDLKVAKGYGTGSTWILWIDDPNGEHLVHWYGSPSSANGRVDNPDTALSWANLTDTATWDVLQVNINTLAGQSEFFFNGTSMGTLAHYFPSGDGRVGSVTFERRDYEPATGYLYFDELGVAGVATSTPVPAPAPPATPTPTPTPTPGPTESVVWTNAVGVSVSGNNLTKAAASAWGNAGAVSTRAIASGDGYIETTVAELNLGRMFGLSNGDTNQSHPDIDFGIFLSSDGTASVWEGGTYRYSFGAYATGDLFRVQVTGGTITYLRNGLVGYTSAATPTYPLLCDTALYDAGATIQGVVIAGDLTGS